MKGLEKYKDRRVVLVDENNDLQGETSLIEAHREPGLLHRAFSLLLFRRRNGQIETLLQLRSSKKPIFPLYWSNSCCYNMAPGESYEKRIVERVKEEMGIDLADTRVSKIYDFVYYAPDKDGWCEREHDSVYCGFWDGEVSPNPDEAEDYRWIRWDELEHDIEAERGKYAPWTRMIVGSREVVQWLNE